VVVALGGPPALGAISRRVFGDSPTIGVETLLQLILCGFAVFVGFVVLRVEDLPLRSIGFRRPGSSTVVTALLLTFVGFVLLPLATGPLVRAFGESGADAGVARLSVLPRGFDCLSAQRAGLWKRRCIVGTQSNG
jgi:hypothetical protein